MKTICVFGGVSNSNAETYNMAAYELGKQIGTFGWAVICSGTRLGMIGSLIDGALLCGGVVSAVVVQSSGEAASLHTEISEYVEAPTLAARKNHMMDVADAFVCLPGGIGTLDEIFNVLAGARMGLHQKKIALLDIDGFFKSLVCFFGEMVEKGFLKKRYVDQLIVEQDVLRLLEHIR